MTTTIARQTASFFFFENSAAGAPTHSAIVALPPHDGHTGDIFYSIGYHYDQFERRSVDDEMQRLLVTTFRNFISGIELPIGWLTIFDDCGQFKVCRLAKQRLARFRVLFFQCNRHHA